MNQQYLPPPLNLLQKKDIHTRKELWKQKIKLFNLKAFDKDFWNSSYDFLPLPKTYNRIQKKVKDWIENNKDRESQYLELQKKLGEVLINIVEEKGKEIIEYELGEDELFELEPPKGKLDKELAKELKKIAIALGKNNWEQIERINNEKIKSSEISQLVQQYQQIKEELREPCFITYNENNIIQFTYHNQRGADLEQENYGFLYRNKLYFISKFTYIDNAKLYCRVEAFVDKIYLYYGNYLRSPGTLKLNRAPLFLENADSPLAESNKLHYSFCNDKGNLVMEEVNNPSIQPRLKTVILDLNTEVSSQHLTHFKAGPNKWDPDIVTNFTMTDTDTVGGALSYITNWWQSQSMGGQTLAFLAPDNYYASKSVQYVSFSKLDGDKGKHEEISLPNIYNQYPHLIHESTVQIFFLNKLIHTGFLNQFLLEEKGGINPDGRSTGKYIVLKFLNQIRANPSGIYYFMSSKSQFWKAELAVSQIYKTKNLIQKALLGLAEKYVGLKDLLGINENPPEEKPQNEEGTKRKYQDPNKGGKKNKPLIVPDLLYANTIDLKYDFLEFANRYSSPSLVFRFQYSNDLLNNLHNSNNKSHELSLDLKFSSLGVLINKSGAYQGNCKLKNEKDGFISEIFQKEVFFYEDLEKDLTNPQLKLSAPANNIVVPISDASIAVGDEYLEHQTFTHQISYQADKREYGHATWFCFSDKEIQESFKSACSCSFSHYYNNAPNVTQTGWCWGYTYDELARSNFLATQFTPQRDCDFVYCLEVGLTPTTRRLQGGQAYNFTFTSTDILISWTVYKRDTEKVDIPTIDKDDLQEQKQADQEEEIGDISELEEDDGENEESDEGAEEEEETESESSDEEEEAESSESESESSESSESSSESSEESESDDESETDDDEDSQEE